MCVKVRWESPPQKLSRVRFMGLSGSSSSVAKQSSLGSGRGLTYFRAQLEQHQA